MQRGWQTGLFASEALQKCMQYYSFVFCLLLQALLLSFSHFKHPHPSLGDPPPPKIALCVIFIFQALCVPLRNSPDTPFFIRTS